VKNRHHYLVNALLILNPAEAPAKGRIDQLCLRQQNGDSLFVNQVIVEAEVGMIYAKSTSDDPVWHMVPIDELVGLEVGLFAVGGVNKAWFKDAQTLPAIIGKLVGEQKKTGGK
jgi:hypothetical protein